VPPAAHEGIRSTALRETATPRRTLRKCRGEACLARERRVHSGPGMPGPYSSECVAETSGRRSRALPGGAEARSSTALRASGAALAKESSERARDSTRSTVSARERRILPPAAPAAERSSRRPDVRGAGRRGSSEDDLPLRLNRAQDRGTGRGLNPAPDEHGPAPAQTTPLALRRATWLLTDKC
jgi:hypothetical protein